MINLSPARTVLNLTSTTPPRNHSTLKPQSAGSCLTVAPPQISLATSHGYQTSMRWTQPCTSTPPGVSRSPVRWDTWGTTQPQ